MMIVNPTRDITGARLGRGGLASLAVRGGGAAAQEDLGVGVGHLGLDRRAQGTQDSVADQFGDLRDYGVSEGCSTRSSVQSFGNPIIRSNKRGCGARPKLRAKSITFLENLPRELRVKVQPRVPIERVGEGNEICSVTEYLGANGCSRYAIPDCIIPARGQLCENIADPSSKHVGGVLHDCIAGLKLANEAGIFPPKAASVSRKTKSSAGTTDILTREPATDDINGNAIGSKSLAGKLSHVAVARHVRPMLGENATGELFDFAERDGLEAIVMRSFMLGALKAETEPAYAAEKVEDAKLRHLTPLQFGNPTIIIARDKRVKRRPGAGSEGEVRAQLTRDGQKLGAVEGGTGHALRCPRMIAA